MKLTERCNLVTVEENEALGLVGVEVDEPVGVAVYGSAPFTVDKSFEIFRGFLTNFDEIGAAGFVQNILMTSSVVQNRNLGLEKMIYAFMIFFLYYLV